MKLAWWSAAVAALAATPVPAMAFSLMSSDLTEGGRFAVAYVNRDCKGENLSPEISWSGAPGGTRSFAVTIYDPDAPKAGGWWHWLAFDIPATANGLRRGASAGGLPSGSRQGRNDYGDAGYDGPCPPPGAPHRYVVTVWALDIDRLNVDAGVAPGNLAAQFQAHSIAQARIISSYGR